MVTPTVFVALDLENQKENARLAQSLALKVVGNFGFKLNLDSLLELKKDSMSAFEFIKHIRSFGHPVFVDLKMWNGRRTMSNIVKRCVELEVDLVNVYAHAGTKFLRQLSKLTQGTKTRLLALNVLTHYDNDYCQRVYGKNFDDSVESLVRVTRDGGVDGLVLAPTMLGNPTVRSFIRANRWVVLCPGIRPEWYANKSANFQQQITTPTQAVEGGANYLVVGSPIHSAQEPDRALCLVLEEVAKAYEKKELYTATRLIFEARAIEIRDVDNGEEPFVYSSGNRGPGYIMIKGMVGQPSKFRYLIRKLAEKVARIQRSGNYHLDFVEGNVTGGVVPGWQLAAELSDIYQRELPYCYLRAARKRGGHNELITGNHQNPKIKNGMTCMVVEELVNYGQTTSNAVEIFRETGYKVDYAACVLNYDHQETREKLEALGVQLIQLITLEELCDCALELGLMNQGQYDSYKAFLTDPVEWQLSRGMTIPECSVEKAESKGYKMRKLEPEEAVALGSPKSKIDAYGMVYYAKS